MRLITRMKQWFLLQGTGGRVGELIDSESKWTQSAFARNRHGMRLSFSDDRASCWCLAGGIFKCYTHPADQIEKVLNRLGLKNVNQLYDWNDNASYSEVQALIKELNL